MHAQGVPSPASNDTTMESGVFWLRDVGRARSSAFARGAYQACSRERLEGGSFNPRRRTCEPSRNNDAHSPMRLSWQPGFSLDRRPAKKPRIRRTACHAASDSSGQRHFEFVLENPLKAAKLGTCTLPSQSTSPSLSGSDVHLSGFLSRVEALHDSEVSERTLVSSSQRGLSISADAEMINGAHREIVIVPPTITYSNVFQRLEPIFEKYNNLFCVIPLTNDLPANPFRLSIDSCQRSQCLAHAVLALSCHHSDIQSRVGRRDRCSMQVLDHRQTAIHLFRLSLSDRSLRRHCHTLLDTILVLFSLDETQSALGNWTTHLAGAYTILDACGGIKRWTTNPRMVAQVGLLTWWDAVTALLSREGCIFPYTYFESAVNNHDDRLWTFFGLCGCPQSLALPLVQLGHLAAEKQKTLSMRWALFDTTPVAEIEESLESWSHLSTVDASSDEESVQQDEDCMHGSEAWRNGLLLYIYRVFWWNFGVAAPLGLVRRARVLVDHVFACRDDALVSRQALLPLFFAGCELTDRSTRAKIVRFCSTCSERTGYRIFSSAIPLLEQVWAEQEAKGPENVWWGQILDRWHSSESQEILPMRVTFG